MTWLVKRVTQQVPIMEQELPALPEHMNSPPIFVVQSLVYSVVFYRSLCVCFSFGHLDHLVLRSPTKLILHTVLTLGFLNS